MMTKARLMLNLQSIARSNAFDPEAAHALAIENLLSYIGDEEITAAFNAVPSL
jgi:hypothetical protein